jgi:hypothetical protein
MVNLSLNQVRSHRMTYQVPHRHTDSFDDQFVTRAKLFLPKAHYRHMIHRVSALSSFIYVGTVFQPIKSDLDQFNFFDILDLKPLKWVNLPSWSWLRVSDEDITPLDTPNDPPSTMQGPMTRARMRQLNLEVSLFLSNHFHSFENRLLPDDVIMLRNITEGHEVLGERCGGGED